MLVSYNHVQYFSDVKTTHKRSTQSQQIEGIELKVECVFFCFSTKACPLNAYPVPGPECTSQQVWESFSRGFTPAVKEVVEFAKGIPGFQELSQQDQVMLLKSGTFQVIHMT